MTRICSYIRLIYTLRHAIPLTPSQSRSIPKVLICASNCTQECHENSFIGNHPSDTQNARSAWFSAFAGLCTFHAILCVKQCIKNALLRLFWKNCLNTRQNEIFYVLKAKMPRIASRLLAGNLQCFQCITLLPVGLLQRIISIIWQFLPQNASGIIYAYRNC
jgi:hypothetical protein